MNLTGGITHLLSGMQPEVFIHVLVGLSLFLHNEWGRIDTKRVPFRRGWTSISPICFGDYPFGYGTIIHILRGHSLT